MARFRPEKAIRWTVLGAILIVVSALAVANRAAVHLSLDPLPWALDAPLYLLILLAVLFGLVLGGLVAWRGQGVWRRRARDAERRLRLLEREAQAQTQTQTTAPPPRLPGKSP